MSAYENVLVGLDVQQRGAETLLCRALELANAEDIEAVHACNRLHHAHSDYPVGSFDNSEALDAALRRQANEYLEAVCAPHAIERHRVLDGNTADAVHDYAREHADLVVVGSHGHHGVRALFGSTSNAMLHGTPCDVLAVHLEEGQTEPPGPYSRLLAAVDLGNESFQVMEEARDVATHCGAELAVCNVTHTSYDPLLEDAAERLGRLADTYGIDEANVIEVAGHVAHQVHQLAAQMRVDLVVMGTHGKHGLQLLSGSKANAVLHGAQCDVLAVRMR